MNEEISIIDRALEGQLTEPELSSFQHSLKSDFQLRQQYYELMATELLLDEKLGKNARMEQAIRKGRSRQAGSNAGPRVLAISAVAAVIILASILTGLYFINSTYEPVSFVPTADSHILIDGSAMVSKTLEPGQNLSIRQGTASFNLNHSTRATITAPAVIRLRDKEGNLDLISGAAYFDVNGNGSNKGISVHTAGRIVRDIGTKFGVIADDSRVGEAHVFSGSISISKNDSEKEIMIPSGNAASWSEKPGAAKVPLNERKFLTSLPISSVLFADDFSEPDGTQINGKRTDTGSSWTVSSRFDPRSVAKTVVSAGRYDSSFWAREIRADLRDNPLTADESAVYVADFQLLPPINAGKQQVQPNGKAKITLHGTDGTPLLSLASSIAENNGWYVVDETTGKNSGVLKASPINEISLRLVYDSRDGKATLRQFSEGFSALQPYLLMKPDLQFRSISVVNYGGCDLALDSLKIESVAYPEKSSSTD